MRLSLYLAEIAGGTEERQDSGSSVDVRALSILVDKGVHER